MLKTMEIPGKINWQDGSQPVYLPNVGAHLLSKGYFISRLGQGQFKIRFDCTKDEVILAQLTSFRPRMSELRGQDMSVCTSLKLYSA